MVGAGGSTEADIGGGVGDMTVYDVYEIGFGWSEIVTSVDDGKPQGGFMVPTDHVLELIKSAEKVMPIVKEKLGL